MNSCRGAVPDEISTATRSCPRSKLEIETTGGDWQPVQFKRILSDDGRTQDERTRKLWIIDASREDKRLARQLVADTCGTGEAQRKAETTDLDSSGF